MGDPYSTRDPERTYQADLRWDYQVGHLVGATVAFGLMGMALAIRDREAWKEWRCESQSTVEVEVP